MLTDLSKSRGWVSGGRVCLFDFFFVDWGERNWCSKITRSKLIHQTYPLLHIHFIHVQLHITSHLVFHFCLWNKQTKKGAHFSSITVNSKSDFRELIIFVHESQIDKTSSTHSTGPPSFWCFLPGMESVKRTPWSQQASPDSDTHSSRGAGQAGGMGMVRQGWNLIANVIEQGKNEILCLF